MQSPSTPTPNSPSSSWRWRGLSNPTDEFWQQLGVRIALAGALYPICVASITLVCAAPFLLMETLRQPENLGFAIATAIITPLYGAPFLFGAGFIYTGLFSLCLTPLVAGTLKLLDERPPRDRVGVFTGSLVAFLATFPFWLLLSWNLSEGRNLAGLAIGYGLLTLALVMGQLAGLSASVADARRRRRGRIQKKPFRLTIWRMLAAMVPLSLALSLLSRAELLTLPTAIAMLAAGGTAYLASRPVTALFHSWANRRQRLRRAKRST